MTEGVCARLLQFLSDESTKSLKDAVQKSKEARELPLADPRAVILLEWSTADAIRSQRMSNFLISVCK